MLIVEVVSVFSTDNLIYYAVCLDVLLFIHNIKKMECKCIHFEKYGLCLIMHSMYMIKGLRINVFTLIELIDWMKRID